MVAPPWTPYESEDFTVPAGATCSFAVQATIVDDKERYCTTAYFPDGSPRYEEWTGQLVIRFTNADTGASVVRVLNGRGDFEYFADGGFTLTDMGGSFAAGLRAGDDGPGAGYYVVQGRGWAVHRDGDGHGTFTYGQGIIENLCETLG
jgi:hypothetical protein